MTRSRKPPPRREGERPAARRPGRGDGAAKSAMATSASTAATPASWPDHPASERARRSGAPAPREGDGNRIAKMMARAGLCSRREAEDWIAAGRVAVNGGTISSPAMNVTERDRVTVDGRPLPRRERTRLFLYHKPAGLVTTNADPEGRATLFDALPKSLPRLMSVGRLDIGTEGLLLLTNDGGLARELERPDTGWVRRYRVRAHGHVSQDDLDRLRDGVTVDGIHYGPIEARLEHDQGANVWLSFAIREGKNREVRNVLAHLGLMVNRLIRVEFGPFSLGTLPEGGIEEVETGNLRAQLGARIAARAGCDFTGPAATFSGSSREERREQRHVIRERLRDARRGSHDPEHDRRPAQKSRAGRDEAPKKPPGRPRRGHAWRQEDAPLHRTYRGSRRDDLKIAAGEQLDKRTGLTTDRKGRGIVVERFGAAKEKPTPAPARGRRGPPRDRAAGPRPSRPRSAGEVAERPGSGRPGKPGVRGAGRSDREPGRVSARGPRPQGRRSGGPRHSGRPPRKH
jgi:23S rRNA pseudouridine2605 synthase